MREEALGVLALLMLPVLLAGIVTVNSCMEKQVYSECIAIHSPKECKEALP